jgi:hypothetical protein
MSWKEKYQEFKSHFAFAIFWRSVGGDNVLDWVLRLAKTVVWPAMLSLLAIIAGWYANYGWPIIVILAIVAYVVGAFVWAMMAALRAPIKSAAGDGAVSIISLRNGSMVQLRQVVQGTATNPGDGVEVWVTGGSGWWRQWTAEISGNTWRVKCQFGDENTKSGDKFKVVAISGVEASEKLGSELPKHKGESKTLSVRRA